MSKQEQIAEHFRRLKSVTRKGATETIEQNRKLRQLSFDLNDACEQLHECAKGIVRLGNQSVQIALKMGDKLREAKSVCDEGKFTEWLTTNCPRISHSYARALMRASLLVQDRQHVSGLESIRALFYFCGIMDPPKPGARTDRLFSFDLALQYIKPATRLKFEDIQKLSLEEQQQIRLQLEPVHQLYVALASHPLPLPPPPPTKESIPNPPMQ